MDHHKFDVYLLFFGGALVQVPMDYSWFGSDCMMDSVGSGNLLHVFFQVSQLRLSFLGFLLFPILMM